MLKQTTLIAVSLLGFWQAAAVAQELLDDNAVILYSLGYRLGQDIKEQELQFRKEILLQGVEDAVKDNQPLFDEKQQDTALASLRQLRAQNNYKASKAFMAENANKEGVVSLPSGLQYKVVKAGAGKIPEADDSVTINIRGTLIDGTEFISSSERGEPVTLTVNKVIKGLSEALQLMPTGSAWELYIPPTLAYGKRSPGKVPANSALIYEVELLSVNRADSQNTP